MGCCYDSAFHKTGLLNFQNMNQITSSEHRPFVHAQDRFSHSADTLRQLARDMLQYATQQGATACAAEVSDGFGQAVTVRQGEVETIEYNRDKGIGISAYLGHRRGKPP